MFVGGQDSLVSINDARWTKSQITEKVILYKEYENINHSFTHAKDMSYL